MPSSAVTYFLNSRSDVVSLETIEISHPSFTKVYRLVRNKTDGLTATLEDGVTQATFDWYPLRITELGDQLDLDTGIRIDFGDLGEVVPLELDEIAKADTLHIKPTVIYRAWRSDDLSAPLIGPLVFEAPAFSFAKEGASFEATAPYTNRTRTGEIYNLTRFFMLRGFLK